MKLDIIQSILRMILRHKPTPDPFDLKAMKTIAVFSNTAIGDTLISTPAFRAIKNSLPNCTLLVVVSAYSEKILANSRFIDKKILYNGKWSGFIKTVISLRRHKPDACFILHSNEPQATPLAYFSGARYIFKTPNNTNQYSHIHYNAVTFPNPKHHGVFDRLKQLEIAGIEVHDPRMDLFLDESSKLNIRNFLLENDISDALKIGFQLGASTRSREWFNQEWAELANIVLSQIKKSRIFLTGSNKDKASATEVCNLVNSPRVIDCTGKFSLQEAAALIGNLDLLITPDTGPLHVAAALGIPTIALYAAADPVKSNPWYDSDIHKVIQVPKTCTPCISKQCDFQKCMKQIKPIDVYNLALEFLER